jgi:hypothetical protein
MHSGFRMGRLKVNHSGNQMGLNLEKNSDYLTAIHLGFQTGWNLEQNLPRESQMERYWGRNYCLEIHSDSLTVIH